MKIFLVGRSASINHWLEDAAAAFRDEGHDVRLGLVRRPWLSARIEAALVDPLAAATAAAAARFAPDLILVIGAFHAPAPFLERLAALPGGPPVAGWVGDVFDARAAAAAPLYDLIGYTDSGLLARHAALGFESPAIFLPHAAAPGAAPPPANRSASMVFVGAATPGRRATVASVVSPMTVIGPGWTRSSGARHDIRPGRIARRQVAGVYAGHLAVLNIRNERNVLDGLNQRSFDPYLSATPVVSDGQGDLEQCFDPDSEVIVWRSSEMLNAAYDRLRRFPEEAARIGEAGRRRVQAEHLYAHRLETLRRSL